MKPIPEFELGVVYSLSYSLRTKRVFSSQCAETVALSKAILLNFTENFLLPSYPRSRQRRELCFRISYCGASKRRRLTDDLLTHFPRAWCSQWQRYRNLVSRLPKWRVSCSDGSIAARMEDMQRAVQTETPGWKNTMHQAHSRIRLAEACGLNDTGYVREANATWIAGRVSVTIQTFVSSRHFE